MRMRQSLAELEQAFVEESSLDRVRRESLQRTAQQRSRKRGVARANKRGTVRFILLAITLLLTAALVTVVMFRTLYLLLG
jgi:Flp pilus assembly protein TadB